MRSNQLVAICSAAVISLYSSVSLAADVVIGVPNWPSAQATAHVLKVALESKLGLEVELKRGSNKEVFDAMDAGTMHVHPEAWLPNLNHLRRQYVIAKKSIKMNPSGATGTQGMCVTRGTAERTGIRSIKELRNASMAQKFDTDGDGKGEVWIGASGWGSTPIEQIRARSYGYDKTMTRYASPSRFKTSSAADVMRSGLSDCAHSINPLCAAIATHSTMKARPYDTAL